MSVRQDILQFLREPAAFATGVPDADRERWLRGLTDFADPVLAAEGRPLQSSQRDAWRGLAERRLGLVLGPPGTGKTHLLAWVAAGYIAACGTEGRPCRVLTAGFTRGAIGNLLEAAAGILADHLPGVPVLFLGEPGGPLPANVAEISLRGSRSIDEARKLLARDHLIVGATTWSLFKLFEHGRGTEGDGPTARVFDLVLIDEASQMLVAQGLMALAKPSDRPGGPEEAAAPPE